MTDVNHFTGFLQPNSGNQTVNPQATPSPTNLTNQDVNSQTIPDATSSVDNIRSEVVADSIPSINETINAQVAENTKPFTEQDSNPVKTSDLEPKINPVVNSLEETITNLKTLDTYPENIINLLDIIQIPIERLNKEIEQLKSSVSSVPKN